MTQLAVDIQCFQVWICWKLVSSRSALPKNLSFSTPTSTSRGTKLCHWKTKVFEQIKRIGLELKIYRWNFEIPTKCSCHGFLKIMKITKIRQSGQNWHVFLSSKQIIRLEIVINSLSGEIFKNPTYNFRSLAKVVIF